MLDNSGVEGYKDLSVDVNGTTVNYGLVSLDDLKIILDDFYMQSKNLIVELAGQEIENELSWNIS